MIEIRYAFINKVYELDINVLPSQVIEHIKCINNESRRNQSLACWHLLNKLIFSIYKKNLCEFSFCYQKNGKPIFKNFYVSLAHSHNLVCCALADEEIGVDVEIVRNLKHFNNLVNKMCYNKSNCTVKEFISCFAKKEAKIKKNGEMLGLQHKSIDLDVDDVGICEIVNDNFELYELAYYPNKEVNIVKVEVFDEKN